MALGKYSCRVTDARSSEGSPRRTQVGELAYIALGPSGYADSPSVKDKSEADRSPLLGWEQVAEVLLDLHRVAGVAEAKALAEPCHVRVDRQPGKAECDREHDVGGLTADARERGELLHRLWHLTPVAQHDRF